MEQQQRADEQRHIHVGTANKDLISHSNLRNIQNETIIHANDIGRQEEAESPSRLFVPNLRTFVNTQTLGSEISEKASTIAQNQNIYHLQSIPDEQIDLDQNKGLGKSDSLFFDGILRIQPNYEASTPLFETMQDARITDQINRLKEMDEAMQHEPNESHKRSQYRWIFEEDGINENSKHAVELVRVNKDQKNPEQLKLNDLLPQAQIQQCKNDHIYIPKKNTFEFDSSGEIQQTMTVCSNLNQSAKFLNRLSNNPKTHQNLNDEDIMQNETPTAIQRLLKQNSNIGGTEGKNYPKTVRRQTKNEDGGLWGIEDLQKGMKRHDTNNFVKRISGILNNHKSSIAIVKEDDEDDHFNRSCERFQQNEDIEQETGGMNKQTPTIIIQKLGPNKNGAFASGQQQVELASINEIENSGNDNTSNLSSVYEGLENDNASQNTKKSNNKKRKGSSNAHHEKADSIKSEANQLYPSQKQYQDEIISQVQNYEEVEGNKLDETPSTQMKASDDSLKENALKKAQKSLSLRLYDKNSLFIFKYSNPIRIFCGDIVMWKYYEKLQLTFVLLNCLMLTLYENEEVSSHSTHGASTSNNLAHRLQILDWINQGFTVIYLIDMILKAVYKGFFWHKRSFVRGSGLWIVTDLTVVISGITEFFVNPAHSMTLRSIRVVFRPLKSFNMQSGMRTLMLSLIDSLPEFANVGIFAVFIFILFATMGLQQYGGTSLNQCRMTEKPIMITDLVSGQTSMAWDIDPTIQRPCSENGFGNFVCPAGRYCGNIEEYLDIPLSHEMIESRAYIAFGITSFDNLGTSLLSVFQMITSETFYTQIFTTMDVDIPFIGLMYSLSVLIVGQFFLLNLVLAVIFEGFNKAHQRKLEEEIRQIDNQQKALNDESSQDDDGEVGEYDSEEVPDEEEEEPSKEIDSNAIHVEVIHEEDDEEDSQHEDEGLEDVTPVKNQSNSSFKLKPQFKPAAHRSQSSANVGRSGTSKNNSTHKEGDLNKVESELDLDDVTLVNNSQSKSINTRNFDSTFKMQSKKANAMHSPTNIVRSKTQAMNNKLKTKTMKGGVKEGGKQKNGINGSGKISGVKKMKSIHHHGVLQKGMTGTASIGGMFLMENEEEERKYEKNEDFTAFLRPQAQKRKIVNLFMRLDSTASKKNNLPANIEVESGGGPNLDSTAQNNQLAFEDIDQKSPMQEIGDEKTLLSPAPHKQCKPLQKQSDLALSLIFEQPSLENQGRSVAGSSNNMLNIASQKKLGPKAQALSSQGLKIFNNASGEIEQVSLSLNAVGKKKKAIQGMRRGSRQIEIQSINQFGQLELEASPKEYQPGESLPHILPQIKKQKLSTKKGTMAPTSTPLSFVENKSFSQTIKSAGKKVLLASKTLRIVADKSSFVMEIEMEKEKHQKELLIQAKGSELHDLLFKKFNHEIQKKLDEEMEHKQNQMEEVEERITNNRFIDFVFKLTQSIYFQPINLTLLTANIVVLSLDYDTISNEEIAIREKFNIFFTLTYLIEMSIQLICFGFKSYFRSSLFNFFDVFILMVSVLDVFIANLFLSEELKVTSLAITVLRGVRILRVFKLARYWRNLEIMLETLWMTIINVASFTCLLLLVLLIYILLGIEFFAKKSKINPKTNMVDYVHGHSPMFNFDTFLNSFMTVFTILTNDGQSVIYLNFYRSVNSSLATFFWITFMVFAQKILLNLFLAILIQNFNEGTLKNLMLDVKNYEIQKKTSIYDIVRWFISHQFTQLQSKIEKLCSEKPHIDENIDDANQKSHSRTSGLQRLDSQAYIDPNIALYGRSLTIIGKSSNLRRILHNILTHKYYGNFIVLCIAISSVELALDSPILDPNSRTKNVLYWIDWATIGIFTLEIIAKMIAYGALFNGELSFFRSIWNALDFFILIFSYLCLTALGSTFKVIKALRILRSLRIIARNEGLKVAIRALFFAIPNVLNITSIMIMFFLIFAVISVSYFKGMLYYCKVILDHSENQMTISYSKWTCLNTGGIWINRVYNFDNISNALVTLFIMATTAGWAENVIYAITTKGKDMTPIESEWPVGWIIFYVIFMIVGCFFFLNLFIGVVINTFNSEQARVGGSLLLTEKQQEWIDLRLLVLRSSPTKKNRPPSSYFRLLCFKIHTHRHFEKFIQFAIVLNTLTLMLKWYRQPKEIGDTSEVLNYVFTVIFVLEAFIRIMSTGYIAYFNDNWNLFDFIVASGSIIGILISQNTQLSINGTSLLRAFRILRLIRLLKRGGQSLYLIFNTFVITMQSLANIGSLLMLIMYIYAIIGMIYFGEVKRNGNMNDYINFESFISAFITLFSVACVDSWNYTTGSFTHGLSAWNNCIYNPTFQDYQNAGNKTVGCGNTSAAFLYFVSFMFIVGLVFLKLFIAIILEGYTTTQVQDSRMFNSEINERFKDTWAEFDPDATSFIKLADIRNFLFALGAPLGFDQAFQDRRYLQDKFIASLELPTYMNFHSYQYLDILDALSFRLMVVDHKNKMDEQQEHERMDLEVTEDKQKNCEDIELKQNIEKEVNRLIFQKQSENIVAFKDLWEKEQKKRSNRDKNKDQTGLTSSHHMALEAGIRRIKQLLALKKQARADASQQQLIEALDQ